MRSKPRAAKSRMMEKHRGMPPTAEGAKPVSKKSPEHVKDEPFVKIKKGIPDC